jgi:hypothetical protein
MRPVIIIALLCALAWAEAPCQTLTNNGATIHVSTKALVLVNGSTLNRDGRIDVQDSAQVTFNGDVTINRGGLFMFRNSLVTIGRNLSIDVAGTCWRYDPGSLRVFGTIFNDGDLANDGEIILGRP